MRKPITEFMPIDNLSSLLKTISKDYDSKLEKTLCLELGFKDYKTSFFPVFEVFKQKAPEKKVLIISELSRACNITQQAIGKKIKDMVKAGYLVKVGGDDKRTRPYKLTLDGEFLLKTISEVNERIINKYKDNDVVSYCEFLAIIRKFLSKNKIQPLNL